MVTSIKKDGSGPSDALITAATAEHFAMQGVVSACVSEQQARASMFLVSVSGAMVAVGIVAPTNSFLVFTAAVIPALYLIGLLTILRLVDVGMESLQALAMIANIRALYRSLGDAEHDLFNSKLGRWPESQTDSGNVVGAFLGIMTTAASLIACVAGFIGGSGIALLAFHAFHADVGLASVIGAAFVLAQVAAVFVYQVWRIKLVERLVGQKASS